MKSSSVLLKLVAFALCYFSLAACSGGQKTENITIDMVAAINNLQKVKLSEYAETVEYIPLELKDSVYLFGGMNILATDDSYVFYTSGKSVDVAFYEFDKSGKYIRSVGAKGRAKGEFLENKGVCFNSVTKDYGLLDKTKLIRYASDGSFKGETSVFKFRTVGFPRLYCENGNYYVNAIVAESLAGMLNGEMKDVVIILDSDGNILEEKVLSDVPTKTTQGFSGKPVMAPNGLMMYANGDIFRVYRENRTDTIKCIDPKTFEVVNYYLLDGVDKGVLMPKFSYMENERYIFMQLLKSLKFFPETEEWQLKNYVLYDKFKGSMRALANEEGSSLWGFENDIVEGGFPFWPSYIRGDKMYQLIGADEFVELAEACGSAKVKEIAAGLTPESNPVLVVATLK